jgi:hypothetical protein
LVKSKSVQKAQCMQCIAIVLCCLVKIHFGKCIMLINAESTTPKGTHSGHITNSVALVRERTIPTKWPPLVGEFSAGFCG